MISPNIRFRVLLLAILPTTAVSVFFFSYFVNKQIHDIEANIVDKGKSLAVHLASASEYGIFSGNMTILSPLIESTFKNNDVVSITITNNQGTPLVKKSKKIAAAMSSEILSDSHNRVFSQPVIQNSIDINDFGDTSTELPPIIGWVIIEVSNETAIKNKREAILKTSSVALLILISSIFLATRVSRHITEPISSLTKAVSEIENGNLDIHIETHSSGALLALEKGIRSMLQSIKSSHWESQQKIDQATAELRESLELLELQNSELIKTRQKALSANQAKSAFLANISHEIRTPMNGILGFVKLLKNTNPNQEQIDYLYTIEQSANNLLQIINDVLDYSKIEAGKISIKNVHFNLEECIEDVLSLIAPSAHEKGLEITSLVYDDTPKELFGAADRVRQILINLIGNAIKFSDSGTIMVRAMLESRSNDALQIKISVTDQGFGISEKDKKILFQSFSQIDESDTRKYGGTGLGLAISKSLTQAMHGDIGVESRKNEGSTFWFTFQCQTKSLPGIFENNRRPLYQNKSVRVYDTNELTCLSISHAFRQQGCDVTECLDLIDLYTPLKGKTSADLCVLSLRNADAINSSIKDFLKSYQGNTDFKILAMISDPNPLTLKSLRNYGADACISKPFRRIEIENILASLFQEKESKLKLENHKADDEETLSRLDGLNILIAEDNAINAKLVETILIRAGASSTVVNTGKKAISTFNNDNFDLILMDIHMPEMNGIDAARNIRNTETLPTRIPIIGLTAVSKSKEGAIFQNPDFDDVLEKPIAVEELLHEISYWAQSRKTFSKHKTTAPTPTNNLGIDDVLSNTLNEMLLNEIPKAVENLQLAFDSNDYRYLRGEIHRLLGGMAYCDFTDLKKLTLKYQSSLKTNSDSIQSDFHEMIQEMKRLSDAGKT